MIKTIRDTIKTTLEAIVDDEGSTTIKVVYNYPESKPTGYPYAIISYKGDESVELTNYQDRVTYLFEVKLVQEKIEELSGRENAEDITMERSYEIATALRDSNDLGLAGVIRVRPLNSEKIYEDNSTRISLKFLLEVETREDIKT